MKKILKGLVKYVAFTVLLACFLPLSLIVILTILLPTTTIHAKEVRYDIASYKGHLIIDNDGNGTFTQEVLYVFLIVTIMDNM